MMGWGWRSPSGTLVNARIEGMGSVDGSRSDVEGGRSVGLLEECEIVVGEEVMNGKRSTVRETRLDMDNSYY